MDTDEEDYVFCGTPIEREEDISSRRKKALAESSGQLRSLPPWKQEVRDEEGRRRFHGAFTGGYSAGFYNTVGSKEGWTPQSFTSSRKSRAEVKQQSILNFLDDDEKAEMEGHSLGTSSQFDTFGFTATEIARKQADNEQQKRPSAIPGPVPDELVLPATESIGMKLLLKMGWRHGHSIRDSRTISLYDARREARKAFLALSSDDARTKPVDSASFKSDIENEIEMPVNVDAKSSQSTPVYVLNPKQDLHGLGFDPFKHAPEFRERKKSRMSVNKELGYWKSFPKKDNLLAFKSGKVGPGFGIGALEEIDDEDADVYACGYDFEDTFVQEIEEPSKLSIDQKQILGGKEKGVLPGFKVASNSDSQFERFDPPVIPKEFVPHHRFPAPLETGYKFDDPGPPEVPPPEDNNLKVLIEGVATLVARCGKLFEDLSREKNQSNPLFCFLIGGNGHDYYARKLWEERRKRIDQTKPQSDGKSFQSVQKLTAESRAKILGEKPLQRSAKDSNPPVASTDMIQLQFNLSDTFTEPASHSEFPEVAKPFKDDPAKQERFELFLKEKYHGGLRSTDSGRASYMSEAARARERLDFEAAAETIERGKLGKDLFIQRVKGILPTAGMQFTSGGGQVETIKAENLTMKKLHPKREEFQWRPSPILCKRFDISDPYMGKLPPPPRMQSKMDSLVFTFDSVKTLEVEEPVIANREPSPVSQPDARKINKEVSEKEVEVELEVENIERPVDLYKAIFSDDSDNEGEKPTPDQVEGPQKKNEVANATLNRLIAGDFLESLGKELGLEVPPDAPLLKHYSEAAVPRRESVNANANLLTINIPPLENKDSSTLSSVGTASRMKGMSQSQLFSTEFTEQEGMPTVSGSKIMECDSYENSSKPKLVIAQEDRKVKTTGHLQNRPSISSSEDERSKKRSRRHRLRSSSSDSESSSDYRERYHSKLKGRKEEVSRENSSSNRRHSKHHKHKSRDSRSRSSHRGSGKEHADAKREKRKWRN